MARRETLKELVVRLEADTRQLRQELRVAERNVDAVSTRMRAAWQQSTLSIRTATRAAGALVVALGAREIGQFVRETISAGTEIEQLAARLGLTTTEVQELQAVSTLLGRNFVEFEAVIQRLSRRIGDAQRGSEGLRRAFEQTGVAFEDQEGAARNTLDVFEDLVRVRDQFTTAAGTSLLGTLVDVEGINLIRALPADIGRIREAARDLGVFIEPEDVARLAEADRNLRQIALTIGGTFRQAVANSSEEIRDITDQLAAGGLRDALRGVAELAITAASGFLLTANAIAGGTNAIRAFTIAWKQSRLEGILSGEIVVPNAAEEIERLRSEIAELVTELDRVKQNNRIALEVAVDIEGLGDSPTATPRRGTERDDAIRSSQAAADRLRSIEVALNRDLARIAGDRGELIRLEAEERRRAIESLDVGAGALERLRGTREQLASDLADLQAALSQREQALRESGATEVEIAEDSARQAAETRRAQAEAQLRTVEGEIVAIEDGERRKREAIRRSGELAKAEQDDLRRETAATEATEFQRVQDELTRALAQAQGDRFALIEADAQRRRNLVLSLNIDEAERQQLLDQVEAIRLEDTGNALEDLADASRDATSQMRDAFEEVSDTASRAFADMLITGEFTFKRLGESLARDFLARLIQAGVGNIFSAVSGGLGSLLGVGRAGGGPVTAGRLYSVNERPGLQELFVPAVPGNIVPVNPIGGSTMFGGGDAPTLIVNVQDVARAGARVEGPRRVGPGQHEIDVIVGESIARQANSRGPGAQAFERTYGLRPTSRRR